ncbi:hypothetical protein D3C81_1940070 [compost metagenome]
MNFRLGSGSPHVRRGVATGVPAFERWMISLTDTADEITVEWVVIITWMPFSLATVLRCFSKRI